MKWLLSELLTREGRRIAKPSGIPVTLQTTTDKHLLAFGENRLEILPSSIEFYLEEVLVRGICKIGEDRVYYQIWWLRPEGHSPSQDLTGDHSTQMPFLPAHPPDPLPGKGKE